MYITYFLKFSSKEEAEEKLVESGYEKVIVENDKVYFMIPGQLGSIDIIGDLYTEPEYRTGKKGYQIMVTPPSKKDGYHVNINSKQEIPEILKPFQVFPGKPSRVFL